MNNVLEKNQEYEMVIEDIGNEGEGIGHVDGIAVFVKDAIPKDTVLVKIIKDKKNYAYGRLMKIIEPSPYRTEPICPHAKRCGGCQIMPIIYNEQLHFKQNKVLNCLIRIAGITDAYDKMEPIIGMQENPLRYRNKAQFPVRRDKSGNLCIGFYAGRTHDVIDTEICYLQNEVNDEILKCFRTFMEHYQVTAYDELTGKGLVRHILTRIGKKTGEVMVCLVMNGDELIGRSSENGKYCNIEQNLVECLKDIPGMTSISINVNKENTNRILGKTLRTIWGRDTITDYIDNIKFQINPLSFYQVNPAQTEKLYKKVLDYADLKGNEIVWDLYCGIGTISLFLARNAKQVIGIEVVPEAIEDARENAELNGFDNVEFFAGRAEEVLPELYEKNKSHPDVMVVDPPRKGCDETTILTMVKMMPKKIVYVSCDPATLARDAKLLQKGGYEMIKWCPTDMFPMSAHVETVVLFVLSKGE